ncbi:MAG: sigma factor [Bryobacteraceae bacterium]
MNRSKTLCRRHGLACSRERPSIEGRSRFETWLFSIARNLAIDGLRQRQILSSALTLSALPSWRRRGVRTRCGWRRLWSCSIRSTERSCCCDFRRIFHCVD